MAEENKNPEVDLDTDGVNEETVEVNEQPTETPEFEKKEDVDLGYTEITKDGKSAIFSTTGNKDCHIILRGGKNSNYDSSSVLNVTKQLEKNNLGASIMIDSSHANSQKDFSKQKNVVRDIQNQIVNGNQTICGLMIESNLVEGRQEIGDGKNLTYGQSITDACIGWNETEELILETNNILEKK